MHGDGLAATRLQPEQWLGHGHLIHNDLRFSQWPLRDAVAGLNDAGVSRFFSCFNARCTREEPADIDSVGGVVSALINDLEDICTANDAGRDLHAARSPTIGKRHLTRTKRDLVTGNRNRFEHGPPDGFFGALVQKTKVVVFIHVHAAFLLPGASA